MGKRTDPLKFHGNRMNVEMTDGPNKQRVRNYLRRKAQRMGIQPRDFVTAERPMIVEGNFRTK